MTTRMPSLSDSSRRPSGRMPSIFFSLTSSAIFSSAHVDAPAPGAVGLADTGRAVDDPAGGEIGPRDVLHELFDVEVGRIDQRHAGVDDFGEVVRRDVGRHADRDAGRTVDEQVRHARRQHRRFLFLAVVVGREIDRLHVDVREQIARDAVETALGVTHRRGGVAVDRTEVALAVDQRVAQGEILRHAHQRVVDRAVAVGVVLTHDVTDHACALHVRAVPDVVGFLHREQHATVHGLEPVAGIGERAADDHAHGVIHVRLAHLVFDVYGQQLAGEIGHRRQNNLLIRKGDFPSPGSPDYNTAMRLDARPGWARPAPPLRPRTAAPGRRDRDARRRPSRSRWRR
jgi:hypothetical protein